MDIINTHVIDRNTRQYAGNVTDALAALQGSRPNEFTPAPGGTRTPEVGPGPVGQPHDSKVLRGIHNLYIKNEQKHFGDHRRNYAFHTNFLQNGYTSFSGSDTTVSILFQGGEPIILGEAQTITYSLFTPMTPVYNLGSHNANGFVRGPRTIAGSIIFTVFDRHALIGAFHAAYRKYTGDIYCLDQEYLSDELPSFDLQVTFLSEYGQSAGLTIHDVRITSEGQVMSIEDMITENTMQYVAADITLMQPDFVTEPI